MIPPSHATAIVRQRASGLSTLATNYTNTTITNQHTGTNNISSHSVSETHTELERVQSVLDYMIQGVPPDPQLLNSAQTFRRLNNLTRQLPSNSTRRHQRTAPQQQTTTTATSSLTRTPSIHPQFRAKSVCTLYCKHCTMTLCRRGMRAILLGDTQVELYSTDIPPVGVQLVYQDYKASSCACLIKDAACLGCGNVVGYHVTQPCPGCLKSCNNGHFYMFHSDGIGSREREEKSGMGKLKWAQIPQPEDDLNEDERISNEYDRHCR